MRIVLGFAAIVIVALAGYLATSLSVEDSPPAVVATRRPTKTRPRTTSYVAVAAATPALPRRESPLSAPDSFDRAKALVEHARASRHWGDDDATQLKRLMFALDEDQRTEVLSTLIPAVNTHEITVDVQGPLY